MLYALLIETVAVERLGRDWTRMSGERRATWFRVWKMLNEELTETIIGTAHWREWEWRLMLTVIAERRRKRKLQRLSRLVIRGLSENSPAQVAKSSNQMSISLLAA